MSILGECPHDDCKHTEWRLLPDRDLPIFSKEKCKGCGRTLWVYYSRVDPKVYPEDAFERDFEVDEATKSIQPRVKA
jgi:hypothetical protein